MHSLGATGRAATAMVRETRTAKLEELFSRATASSAERRDHLGREPVELLRVVDERVEQNQVRTGVRHRTDAGGALLGRAREDVFRPAAPPVVSRERVLESLAPARRIVLDVDIDALADPERVGLAALCAQLLPHHLHLFGELSNRLGAGAHEPASVPDRAPHPRRRTATEPDWRVRLLHRLWLHRRALELPEPPSKVDLTLRPARLHQRQG